MDALNNLYFCEIHWINCLKFFYLGFFGEFDILDLLDFDIFAALMAKTGVMLQCSKPPLHFKFAAANNCFAFLPLHARQSN